MDLFILTMMDKIRPLLLMNGAGWSGIIFLQTIFKPEEDSKVSFNGTLLIAIGALSACVIFLFKYVIKSHKEAKESASDNARTILTMNKDNFDAWQRMTGKINEEHEEMQEKMEKLLKESWKVINDNTASNQALIKSVDEVRDVLRKQLSL